MAFIYITGPAGSGKSTLTILLRQKGIEAYDEDDPNIGSAHSLETGEPVSIPSANERDSDWFSRHEWKLLDAVKHQLRSAATERDIILFGNSMKPHEQIELFDKVIYLKVDENTLRQRILDRTDNDYGQSEDELQQILNRKQIMDDASEKTDTTIIDANKPIEEVASAIQLALRP